MLMRTGPWSPCSITAQRQPSARAASQMIVAASTKVSASCSFARSVITSSRRQRRTAAHANLTRVQHHPVDDRNRPEIAGDVRGELGKLAERVVLVIAKRGG